MKKVLFLNSIKAMAALTEFDPEITAEGGLIINLGNNVQVYLSSVNRPGVRTMALTASYNGILMDETRHLTDLDEAIRAVRRCCVEYGGIPADAEQAQWMAEHYHELNFGGSGAHCWTSGITTTVMAKT